MSAHNDMGYECICPKGYTGTNCSVIGVACYPGYCSNHGECSNTDAGPSCTCQLGYKGDNCETGNSSTI